MIDVISRLLVPFFFALVISVFLTPISMKIAKILGAIDDPKEHRKIHTQPIPRLGGIAIFTATMLSSWIWSDYSLSTNLGISLGAIIIVATGILDDLFELSAKVKLVMQILAAITVVSFGIQIEIFTAYFSNTEYIHLGILGIPATILWIVGITNTVNLIDGLDGLAAGTAIIASVTLTYIAIVNQRYEAAILLVSLAGGALGFLPFNFNPARVFMGDCGSLFLGYYLAVISVLGAVKGAATITYLLPIVVLGLPIFDTLFAIVRRFINQKPIMQADKGHLHHRFLDIGLNHKKAVLALYAISVLLGLTAAFYSVNKYIYSLISLILVLILVMIPMNRTSDVE